MIYGLGSPFIIIGALFGFVFSLVFIMCLTIVQYIFFSYVFARIGAKFGVGSSPRFFVPIYNIVLLCDCAGIERWVAAGVVLPFILGYLRIVFFGKAVAAVALAANVYLWGKLAERLGKNFWLWGFITPILWWLPSAVLAFDSSRPIAGADGGKGERYINLK